MHVTELIALISSDLRANGADWTRPGFRALAVHRFGVWRMSISSRWLRVPFSVIYRMAFRHCRNVYGIELPFTVKVGRNVIIDHQGGIVIHGWSVIGDGCRIRHNCTLGIARMDDLDGAPVLGRNVDLGAGSVILGRVVIGNDVQIGANAVVLTDVPDGALAIGVPAIVRERQSAKLLPVARA